MVNDVLRDANDILYKVNIVKLIHTMFTLYYCEQLSAILVRQLKYFKWNKCVRKSCNHPVYAVTNFLTLVVSLCL